MNFNIDTSQLKVLKDFFDELSIVDQHKIFMTSFRKAEKPLVDAAKANAPKSRMNLYRSIGTIEMPKEIAILVGSRINTPYVTKQGRLSKVWYGNLVELGHKVRGKKRGQPGSKIVPGTHFFENAWNTTSERMYNSMADEWYNALDRYIIKLNRKLKK
jgi:hypothetical protein